MTASVPCTWSNSEATGSRLPRSVDQLPLDELVLRCQKQPGDRPAFTELVRRYQNHVERLIYHLAPDWEDRADLVQEVWIRVYRNLKNLQEPRSFKGWLSRIVTNLFYDELRRRKRRQPALSLDAPRLIGNDQLDWELPTDQAGPDEELEKQEFYGELRRAIAGLPESFRTTIVLREIEGLAYEEIAAATGVSLGTVKSRIARARQRLQDQLSGYLKLF